MDEYIKRSEVIDLVEKAIKKCSTEKTTKGVLVCAHLRTAVMGLRSADVAPRAEWISVEERLPDNDWGKHWKERKYYLVFTKPSGLMNVAVYGYKEHDWWIDRNSCVLDKKNYNEVTHWMPLPEPPKDLENFEKKRLLPGDCFHGEIWYMCPYCFTGEAHSIPKDRICHKCGKEYL